MRRLQILNELADGREKSDSELEKVIPDLSQSIFYSVQSAEALKILKFLTKLYANDVTIGKTKH